MVNKKAVSNETAFFIDGYSIILLELQQELLL